MSGAWRVRGYSIEQLLGSGSSGDVWRARISGSGEQVALKRMPAVTADQARQAEREAALLAGLDHPHLVRLHALEQQNEYTVLVLDLADGGSLGQLLEARGRLTPGEVITTVAPVAAALAYLHDEGVVHGDVSAANILFTAAGVPLLADVGVARITGDDSDAMSTPAYVDPSVAAGCVPGAQSDVFMLAGVALHALTGTPPWPGESAEAALDLAARGKLHDVGRRLAAAGVDEAMARVLGRALNVDPHRRGTAADLALDLRHSGEPVAVELAAGRARSTPVPAERSGPRHAAAVPAPGRRGRGRHPSGRPDPPASPDGQAPPDLPAGAAVSPAGRADPARPAFERPATGGAAPPTRLVGVRPRPVLPRRRAARSRALGVASGLMIAGLLAGAGTVWASSRSGPAGDARPAALRTSRGPAASSVTAPPSPLSSSSPVPSSSPSSSPVPLARPRTSAARQLAPVDWRQVLDSLDMVRARAFATRSTALLAGVYVAGPLRRADATALLRLVPPGCGLDGVRTTYTSVRARPDGARMVVTATATLPVTRLICAGRVRATARGSGPMVLRVELVRTGAGQRIAALRHG